MRKYKQEHLTQKERIGLFMPKVSLDDIRKARKSDLLGYLQARHPDKIVPAGAGRARFVDHDSCVITRGLGYCHNSRNETGNSIDFLVNYLGYSFADAVEALCAFGGFAVSAVSDAKPLPMVLPARVEGPYQRLYAYLTGRGISADTITRLVDSRLLYEDAEHHNAVFVAKDLDFAELHGTLTQIRYKSVVSGSDPDGYWSCGATDNPETAYVCESAIDAVSLAELQYDPHARYCSIAGVKPNAVRRIIRDFPTSKVILAVDNDEAGSNLCDQFPDLSRQSPNLKDWNDDLRNSVVSA